MDLIALRIIGILEMLRMNGNEYRFQNNSIPYIGSKRILSIVIKAFTTTFLLPIRLPENLKNRLLIK